jgi:hypothetical protein
VPALRPELAPAEAVELTPEQTGQLARWAANPTVNPQTGRPIAVGGQTHARVARAFAALRDSADAAKVERANALAAAAQDADGVRACESISAHEDRRAGACAQLSACARRAEAARATWAEAVQVVRGRTASFLSCGVCRSDCRVAVTRAECARCAAGPDESASTACACRTRWTIECAECACTLVATFATFSATRGDLHDHLRAAGC